ncbi:glycoside hydrolase family 38 N-terminal domain-containing protein [Celerinatantimonas yamalensis]|uniref:Glycoside hydrolase family 38 C-terminal domain-containing protein n=1 Tax=Celerinatantimonas yamalensis TaxID=559956 RepID=A0ABW9G5N3_9GAMM
MSKVIHVIAHTHWDYEWYFTHSESTVQLVYHLDDLFDAFESGQLTHYILDGQLSIVEDYLALVPRNKAKLSQWVCQNKLKIGPWYTQTDQLIISGESIVRNLQLGIESARHLGGCWMMGYVPDAFGQSIDMPKIYAGFDIKRSVFWRGLASSTCPTREFNWRSEDGSQVQCYQLRNGYYLAEEQIRSQHPDDIVTMIAQDTNSHHLPMPYGADQIKVDTCLTERINTYNRQSQHQFIQSSYEALFDGINTEEHQLATIEGEMIDGQFSKIHRSIYSTRYDHKQLNDKIETHMSLVLEPLMLMASQLGIPYKQGVITALWKQLLRNHAHDSAGGCNSDRTNQQILQRLTTTAQMTTANIDFLVHKLAESYISANTQHIPLMLLNTLPVARHEVTVVELATEQPEFQLIDPDGKPVTYTLLSSTRCYRGSIKRDPKDHDPALYYYQQQIEFFAELPALGFCCYSIQECKAPTHLIQSYSLANASIQNQRLHIELRYGQLHLTDTLTQSHWQDFLTIYDMGDDGDNYDYSPPQQDWQLSLNFTNAQSLQQTSATSQRLILEGHWLLPANLAERALHQCSVKQTYRLSLILRNDGPLEIDLMVDNKACDHRMQLLVHSDIQTTDSIADTPFGCVQRANHHPLMDNWQKQGWKEEPSAIYPLIHHVSFVDHSKSLTLYACGIKEYQVYTDFLTTEATTPTTALALTLFRSIGWLGKPDLQRRPGVASGQQFKYIPTPDSQLLQPLTFKIGLDLHPNYQGALLMQNWQRLAVPIISYQQQQLNRFTNTMKYFGVNPLPNALASRFSLLTINAPQLVCSAIKQAQADEGWIIRIYNPASYAITDAGFVQLPEHINTAALVNLNEQQPQPIPIHQAMLHLGLFAPKQIKTFKVYSA